MIGYIKGVVAGILPDGILLENNGIGYHIYTSTMAIGQLTDRQGEVMMYTHLHVREDEMSLFGFPTTEELQTFQLLLTVNGIGPKAALAILSALTVRDLSLAILAGDVKAITRANGIGAKGANRIIMELKDKLDLEDVVSDVGGDLPLGERDAGTDSVSDTVLALVSLGYSESEAVNAIRKVENAGQMDSEELLKQALKKIF